jgi:hypothetical protein
VHPVLPHIHRFFHILPPHRTTPTTNTITTTATINTTNNQQPTTTRYSFERGPVHFIVLDTDAWYFDEVAYVLQPQWTWLLADLAAVDRSVTPWVIMMGHRPMYCSLCSSSSTDPATSTTEAASVTGGDVASVTAPVLSWGDHLGWPKQRDDGKPVGRPPPGYGAGFARLGTEL